MRTASPVFRGDFGRQRGAVRGAAHRLGRGHVELSDAHRLGDGAEPANGLDRPAEAVGRNRAGLSQTLGKPAKRFLVEPRHRRAAKLVVNHEPHRIRSDVDDGVVGPVSAHDARGIEIKRPLRLLGLVHRAPPIGPIMRNEAGVGQCSFQLAATTQFGAGRPSAGWRLPADASMIFTLRGAAFKQRRSDFSKTYPTNEARGAGPVGVPLRLTPAHQAVMHASP